MYKILETYCFWEKKKPLKLGLLCSSFYTLEVHSLSRIFPFSS